MLEVENYCRFLPNFDTHICILALVSNPLATLRFFYAFLKGPRRIGTVIVKEFRF